MKNNNDEAIKNYFDSMLRPETDVTSNTKAILTADLELPAVSALPNELVFSNASTSSQETLALSAEVEMQQSTAVIDEWQNIDVKNEFQVLFFELNHVTFAVPLTDLGGIYHLTKDLNFLMGKPAWFLGVNRHNGQLYNIVDTSLWLQLGCAAKDLQYSHYILLGSTNWGLSCEKLLGTENLTKDQVRWRDKKGSRPWLAGMVKDKMCALIHADELIKLLNKGMDIRG